MTGTPLSVNDLVAAELRAHAARKGVTGRGVADRLDLPPMWVQRRLSGTATVSVEDLVRISEGIGVYPLDVLAQVLHELEASAPATTP